jgi:hypothetical protein
MRLVKPLQRLRLPDPRRTNLTVVHGRAEAHTPTMHRCVEHHVTQGPFAWPALLCARLGAGSARAVQRLHLQFESALACYSCKSSLSIMCSPQPSPSSELTHTLPTTALSSNTTHISAITKFLIFSLGGQMTADALVKYIVASSQDCRRNIYSFMVNKFKDAFMILISDVIGRDSGVTAANLLPQLGKCAHVHVRVSVGVQENTHTHTHTHVQTQTHRHMVRSCL